jgi:hypothetical protein
LAPDLLAGQQRRQQRRTLRGGPEPADGRPDHVEPDEPDGLGSAYPGKFLAEDVLVAVGQSAPAPLRRPVDPDQPGVVQGALPGAQLSEAEVQVVRDSRDCEGSEPVAHLCPEYVE